MENGNDRTKSEMRRAVEIIEDIQRSPSSLDYVSHDCRIDLLTSNKTADVILALQVIERTLRLRAFIAGKHAERVVVTPDNEPSLYRVGKLTCETLNKMGLKSVFAIHLVKWKNFKMDFTFGTYEDKNGNVGYPAIVVIEPNGEFVYIPLQRTLVKRALMEGCDVLKDKCEFVAVPEDAVIEVAKAPTLAYKLAHELWIERSTVVGVMAKRDPSLALGSDQRYVVMSCGKVCNSNNTKGVIAEVRDYTLGFGISENELLDTAEDGIIVRKEDIPRIEAFKGTVPELLGHGSTSGFSITGEELQEAVKKEEATMRK